jgi:hypothetical protein
MGRLSCLFRRHQWYGAMDPKTNRTWRECRRCGVVKTSLNDLASRSPTPGDVNWGP